MKPRKGIGTVFQRDWSGKWIGRVRWKDDFGNVQEKSFTCDSEKDAWSKLSEFHKQRLKGVIVASAEPTFGEWTKEVVEKIFKPRLRPSTLALYEGLVKNHLHVLANVKLSKLTVDQIESLWFDKRVTIKRKVLKQTVIESRPMSKATKHQIRRLTINILNHAVRKRKIRENIANHTVIVDPTPPKQVKSLSVQQAANLLEKTASPRFKAVFATQLMLGLRIGEALGIRLTDIEGDKVNITQQVQRDRDKKELVLQDLKTVKSRRTLPVPKDLLEIWEAVPKKGELLFHTSTGEPIDPRNAQRALSVAAKAAGLEDVSTHVLRHTYASINVTAGVPINVISNALGHTHLSTTMIYAEAEIGFIREANDRVANLFKSKRSTA